MFNKILLGGIVACLFIGLSFALYPTISNAIYEYHVKRVVKDYNDSVAQLDAEKRKEEWRLAEQYNLAVLNADSQIRDSFTYQSEKQEGYQDILNTDGNGMMGVISIPKINVKLPILHGDNESVLYRGIGHMPNTSLPIGGVGNHSVLVGHSGISHATLFSHLTDLAVGDTFTIQVMNRTMNYEVVSTKVVTPEQNADLYPVEGKDLVTLLTCTPIGVNSHRLLVRGERTSDILQTVTINPGLSTGELLFIATIAVVSFVVIGVLVHGARKRRSA